MARTSVPSETARAALEQLRDLLDAGDTERARTHAAAAAARFPDDQRVVDYARILAPPRVVPTPDLPGTDADWRWLHARAREYPGQFLSLYGGELLAAGPDGEAVLAEAEARAPGRRVLLYWQPPRQW